MKIKTPKYRYTLTISLLVFALVIFFEVVPGYYQLCSNLLSVLVEKISGDDYDKLSNRLDNLKSENSKLKKVFFGEFSSGQSNHSFSETLDNFNVSQDEFDMTINSIKPLKKVQKGRLNFQRISLELQGDYENIYNYCRWLEMRGKTFHFEEVIIARQKDKNFLKTNMLIDVLHKGSDQL